MIGPQGVASGNPDPYGPPLPGANQVRELERWCPHGVKRILTTMDRHDSLDDVNPVILQWMQQHGLARRMQQGVNAGHLALSVDGQRVRSVLKERMAGKH